MVSTGLAVSVAARKPIVAVAFYSTYGHIGALADAVIKGVETTGAEVRPYFIEETLPESVLSKMHAGGSLKPKYPLLTPDALKEVDGLVLGAPTRYGRVPAQVSAFFDRCGGLWATGALNGKFVTMFTSTAGQHGGQETTALTTVPFFAHMGLVFVPLGYTHKLLGDVDEISGGAPWGASTISRSDGSRMPSEAELTIAEHQGKYFADFVSTFVRGKQALAAQPTPAAASTVSGPVEAKAAPVLGEPVAVGSSVEDEKKGFSVPASTDASNTVAPTPTTETPAAAEPTTNSTAVPASKPEVESKPAEATAPAPTPAAAAAAPAHASSSAPKEKKSGGGLFGCCGGKNID